MESTNVKYTNVKNDKCDEELSFSKKFCFNKYAHQFIFLNGGSLYIGADVSICLYN